MAGMPERFGFIGVGLMGHGMAKCLVEKGHALTVMGHRNLGRSTIWSSAARRKEEAPEVARNSDIVFLCVTGSAQVEALVRGPDGIAAGAHEGLTVVDFSTSDPNSTVALGAELKALGVAYADAPLGGGAQDRRKKATLRDGWLRCRGVAAHRAGDRRMGRQGRAGRRDR